MLRGKHEIVLTSPYSLVFSCMLLLSFFLFLFSPPLLFCFFFFLRSFFFPSFLCFIHFFPLIFCSLSLSAFRFILLLIIIFFLIMSRESAEKMENKILIWSWMLITAVRIWRLMALVCKWKVMTTSCGHIVYTRHRQERLLLVLPLPVLVASSGNAWHCDFFLHAAAATRVWQWGGMSDRGSCGFCCSPCISLLFIQPGDTVLMCGIFMYVC